jgi:uncharacterized protein YjbJ (UPF0337 family)
MAGKKRQPSSEAKAKEMRRRVTRDEIRETEDMALSALHQVKDTAAEGANRLNEAGSKTRKRGAKSGLKERLAGKAMQWEGKATGDPIRETEGKALSAFGRLKHKLEIARDNFKDRVLRSRK